MIGGVELCCQFMNKSINIPNLTKGYEYSYTIGKYINSWFKYF